MRRELQTQILNGAFDEARQDTATLPRQLRRLGAVLAYEGMLNAATVSIETGSSTNTRPYSFTSMKLHDKGVQIVSMSSIAEHAFVLPLTAGADERDQIAMYIHSYLRLPEDRRGALQTLLQDVPFEVSAVDMRDNCNMWDIKLLSAIEPILEIRAKSDAELDTDLSNPFALAEDDEQETGPTCADPALLALKFG